MGQQTPPEEGPEKKKDPWGRDIKRSESPPDLDVLINKLSQKLKEMLSGKKSGSGYNPKRSPQNATPIEVPKHLPIVVAAAVLLVWIASGIFIV